MTLSEAARRNVTMSLCYIRSEDNPADAPSRAGVLQPRLINQWITHFKHLLQLGPTTDGWCVETADFKGVSPADMS